MAARKPKKLLQLPPIEEIESLLRATTRERDRLMLFLARYMGLRVSEIVHLKAQDLDFRRGFLLVDQGKGAKDAKLPMPGWLARALRGWCGARTSGPVFPSRQGGVHMNERSVRYLLKRIAVAAGLPDPTKSRKWHPHLLRHVFCTEKLRRGVPVVHVQRLMRHENVQTTMRYSHLVPEDLREAMEA